MCIYNNYGARRFIIANMYYKWVIAILSYGKFLTVILLINRFIFFSFFSYRLIWRIEIAIESQIINYFLYHLVDRIDLRIYRK